MKKIMTILACFIPAVLIVVFLPMLKGQGMNAGIQAEELVYGQFDQRVERVNSQPATVFPVYENDQLLGYLSSDKVLNQHLKDIYSENYQNDYPNSRAQLAGGVMISTEESYFTFSDIDEKILAYLDEKNLYAIEATAVTFSENNEIYSRIYVKDQQTYENAFNAYVSLFADITQINAAQNSSSVTTLTTFGSRDVSVSISQTVTAAREYTKPENIMTEEEVLEYLKYGTNKEREYYTVRQYDTVAGVGAKNHGLSATQVMNINKDKISSVDQVLKEGEELCVTYFTSPIDIVVNREVLRSQPIYYTTESIQDDSLFTGESKVYQEGMNGLKNVLYDEKWINGVLVAGNELSSVELQQPTPEILYVGAKQLPNVGTGDFIFPVDFPEISCPWGCYYGHTGTDIVNAYERWGNVYAVDNGTIEVNDYNYINGNYVVINHNNGVKSYYGHMREKSFLNIGDTVQKGQQIGYIGMTGLATGPHVHFHVYIGDSTVPADACNGYLDCSSVNYQ